MLSELIEEIENRFRVIIREEIKAALIEAKGSPEIQYESGYKRKHAKTDDKLPSLLAANDVAEMLGVNVQRVYEIVRKRKSNGFPVIIIGERQYRFDRDAVLKWINRES